MKVNPFKRIFLFLSGLIIVLLIGGISLYFYLFSTPDLAGRNSASWPLQFTRNFGFWLDLENDISIITDTGLAYLDEFGLWFQLIDENGVELTSHNRPNHQPTAYTASQLISLADHHYEDGYTIFVSQILNSDGTTLSYLIGFPHAIGKYIFFYNYERVGRMGPLVINLFFIVVGALVVLALLYGLWLVRELSKITKGIEALAFRNYQTFSETGIFAKIYRTLNQMNEEIKISDATKLKTDRLRQEWIANITHDLKTPLSPVKGYAELLSNHPEDEIKETGTIILRNVNHTEQLINDLKLTYQLEAGALPYNPKPVRLQRFLKELLIDLINDPHFSEHNLNLECDIQIKINIDSHLLRRALQNVIINALVHNPPETHVIVWTKKKQSEIQIHIQDNGRGIKTEQLATIFERYYRGTHTRERTEGTGLGLAIAKQIIELHQGTIHVTSKPETGTDFIITLPILR